MLRYSLLSLPTLLAGPTFAQTSPSITAADMPAVGDSLRLSQAATTLPTTAPPLARSGANQIWNYAGLAATSQRVERYAAVSTATGLLLQLTFNSAFNPDNRATLVVPRALPAVGGLLPITDPLEFSTVSAADFRLVGYGGTFNGTAVPLTYVAKNQQDIIYRFPLSYTNVPAVSNSLLTTPAALAATGYFSQKRERRNQADAWGTLTTPFGTFQTVRVVTTITDHDSLSVGGNSQALDLPIVHEYKWLAKGVHVPVLTITTATVAGREVITGVEYRDIYRRFTPLAGRSAAGAAGFSTYPNPSAVGTALQLAVPAGSGPLSVVGTDLLGRRLFAVSLPAPSGEATLGPEVFGQFRGVALLTVQSARGVATQRVVRE
ncbi:MAG: hypothetical protein EOO62_09705 [Hymenobacter sp.]|nr:MAG: hypothetical protein EOO62_09705 [Hymenobacter sp.]